MSVLGRWWGGEGVTRGNLGGCVSWSQPAGLYSEEERLASEALGQPALSSLDARPQVFDGASVSWLNPQPSTARRKTEGNVSIPPALVKLHPLVQKGVQSC